MNYKEIAAKLLAAFNESPYSYGDLAKLTGIPKSALQRYITGDTEKIPMDRLREICGRLGLDVAELIGWNGNGTEPQNPAVPRTLEARIVSFGMDQLPQEEREKILFALQTMYAKNPQIFKRGDDEDEPGL